MKTFPFLRMLIHLYWLLLVVLIGGLIFPLFNRLSSATNTNSKLTLTAPIANGPALSPELLATITTGKKLFKINCAACHNKNMKSDMTGPALAGVRDRWDDFPETDLFAWIRNAGKLIDAKHPRAMEIAKWSPSEMTAFNSMTNEDIAAVLAYVESVE